MIGILFFFLIVILVAFLVGIALYNQLMQLRVTRENSMQQLSPHLSKRFELMPLLLEAVKDDAKRKKAIQLVLKSRTQAKHPEELVIADNQLEQMIS